MQTIAAIQHWVPSCSQSFIHVLCYSDRLMATMHAEQTMLIADKWVFLFCSKKYIIEQTQGEKILRRKKGITTLTCVNTSPMTGNRDFPTEQFQTCMKVPLNGVSVLVLSKSMLPPWCLQYKGVCWLQAEAKEVAPACASSCQRACAAGIEQFTSFSQSFSGFASAAEDVEHTVKSCTRRCTYECAPWPNHCVHARRPALSSGS